GGGVLRRGARALARRRGASAAPLPVRGCPLHRDRPPRVDRSGEARDALLAVGDHQTAAEAELSISRIWWHRGQRDESTAAASRAEELAGAERSPARARVLANVARTRSIAGDRENGLRLAGEALEMAESLRLDELRAHALATISLAKMYVDDPPGVEEREKGGQDARAGAVPKARRMV